MMVVDSKIQNFLSRVRACTSSKAGCQILRKVREKNKILLLSSNEEFQMYISLHIIEPTSVGYYYESSKYGEAIVL